MCVRVFVRSWDRSSQCTHRYTLCCQTQYCTWYIVMLCSWCWSWIVYLQWVYLRSKQKLVIMIWQTFHILTQKGRICVQCVTNGSRVVRVWMCTVKDTLAKMCIRVLNVRNVFHLWAACLATRIFIQVNTSAQNVENVVAVVET